MKFEYTNPGVAVTLSKQEVTEAIKHWLIARGVSVVGEAETTFDGKTYTDVTLKVGEKGSISNNGEIMYCQGPDHFKDF